MVRIIPEMTNEEICAVQHGAETAFDRHGAGVCKLLVAAGVRKEQLYVPWAAFRRKYEALLAETDQRKRVKKKDT